MTFYDPTFPNETHYEKLLRGRQRFGNLSANMFFVRPARHIACPRRLKYIYDIKTAYIPYVEDAGYFNQPSYKHVLQKTNNDINKTNGLGLYNSADTWRHELMELAQQVKSSLISTDEQEQGLRQSRSAHLNKHHHKKNNTPLNCSFDENNERNVSKRLLYRRAGLHYQRAQTTKPKFINEKSEQEQSVNDENQDPGIWLIPILCYILQIDNVSEAQDWLVNANPTEKRLAMELISRTMQDMQNLDSDLLSDVSTSDQSSTISNLNNVYWPYKIFQRQEKDRQQTQNFLKQSKLNSYPLSSIVDNGETCERATSPLRILTPAKRLSKVTTPNNNFIPVETTVIERPSTRNSDRTMPTIVVRQSQSQMTDRPTTVKNHSSSTLVTPILTNENDRLSRRSHRVTTSVNNSINDNTNTISTALRGKTPLI